VSEISLIIPAYNRSELIAETLRSLLNQTIPAKEIIVVDDGSTDDTARVVERIAEELEVRRLEIDDKQGAGSSDQGALDSRHSPLDSQPAAKPRLRVIRQQNAGPGVARNRGLAEATGEFIHFFDSDDVAAPNKHEVQLRALLETGADIAYGPWVKGRFVNLTTNDTNGHEKVEELLTTIERQGGREKEQPKVGPKGEGVGTTESKDTESTEEEAVLSLGKPSGAAFSNPSTSELARDCENASPTRSASGPAEALFADHGEIGSAGGNQLADSKEFLECQSQAGLQMDNQKNPTIRTANDPSASGEYSSSVLIRDIRGSKYSLPLNFVPEGPVLQARGLPHGDLLRALLTNWSIVPHACLFRRSILEKAGGFPEDIWVGEDQLLFLRCLLAGAKVVHSPETMVFYRVGNDPGKLTATGAAQKRHARDWARFLVKANQEVTSAEWRVTRVEEKNSTTNHTNLHERGEKVSTTIERQGGREKEQPKVGPKGEGVGTTESNDTDKHGYQKNQNGNAQGTCAGAAFSNPSTSELARASENTSLTRCVSGSAEEALRADYMGSGSAGGNQLADSKGFLEGQSQAGLQMDNQKDHTIRTANDLLASRKQSDENSVNFVNPVKNCFGFRLRAYEAWRDLENFFPGEENELKNELQGIWKRNWFSGSRFQISGFVLRKLGGLKLRVLGYREHASFRCGRPSEVGFPPHEGQRR
jgi:GT2 family glycosyltransferase